MIGRVVSRLALTAFYFVVVTPMALVRRAVGGNPMQHGTGDMGYWQRRDPESESAAGMQGPS